MSGFFGRPLNWVIIALGMLIAAMTAFAVFQPVQVIPRIAYGPSYELTDQWGQPSNELALQGKIVLYGFGYTSDPTDTIDLTLDDMRGFQTAARAEDYESEIMLVLILFDDQRDTPDQLQDFAREHELDLSNWVLLSGDAVTLKKVIGQGFGVYYEAVPLAELLGAPPVDSDDYGYLQAHR